MTVLQIDPQPSGDESHFRVQVVLEGVPVDFRFYTNGSDGRWYFDFEVSDGAVRGVAMVAGLDLFAPYRHLALPPGWLWVEADADPDHDAFLEDRAKLLYLEAG